MTLLSRPDIILHPVRIRIIFALQGRRLTPQQIGHCLPDTPQATLYRHLKLLLEAEVISVVEQRPVHGTVEKVYALVGEATNLTDADMAGITREQHEQYFTVFISGLLSQFSRYLRQNTVRRRADGLMYYEEAAYLSESEAESVCAQMRRLVQTRSTSVPGPGRRRYTLAVISIPDPEENDADSRP